MGAQRGWHRGVPERTEDEVGIAWGPAPAVEAGESPGHVPHELVGANNDERPPLVAKSGLEVLGTKEHPLW